MTDEKKPDWNDVHRQHGTEGARESFDAAMTDAQQRAEEKVRADGHPSLPRRSSRAHLRCRAGDEHRSSRVSFRRSLCGLQRSGRDKQSACAQAPLELGGMAHTVIVGVGENRDAVDVTRDALG